MPLRGQHRSCQNDGCVKQITFIITWHHDCSVVSQEKRSEMTPSSAFRGEHTRIATIPEQH